MPATVLWRQKWTGQYDGDAVTTLRADVTDTHDLFGFKTLSLLPKVTDFSSSGEPQQVALTPFVASNGTIALTGKMLRGLQLVNYDATAIVGISFNRLNLYATLWPKSCRTFYLATGLEIVANDAIEVRYGREITGTRVSTKKFKFGITVVADNP